jgi:Pao retrotransposon peptidase./Reverse transcriptase (RNA-dependent DNA polymerase).
LNTVTYGLAASPFLAIRCLHQAAKDNAKNYPFASRIIQQDFYVDDLLTGANSIEEIKQIKTQTTHVLQSAGFPLVKWKSNEISILEIENDPSSSSIQDVGTSVKTLGLRWNPHKDQFLYHVQLPSMSQPVTKRTILSTISQIFDPLGLIGPLIVIAKIIL